jgi:hypothetical protein
LDSVNQFLAQRKNPNGCDIKMTYFTSLNFTNYTLVTGARVLQLRHGVDFFFKFLSFFYLDWYVAGNEIADHTSVTHDSINRTTLTPA